MRSKSLTIGEGAACAWPFQPYSPADATPEQHMGLREGLYRQARRDGLDKEAAEEAASAFYLHWLGRNYAATAIPRGDHLRAFYSVRALGKRTLWKGSTGSKRACRRAIKAEMLAWRERRRASMIPQPWQPVAEFDRLEDQPWTKTARAVADAAHAAGMTPAAYVAAAYGTLGDQPVYAGHPQPPQPQPWTEEDHAAIVNRLPAAPEPPRRPQPTAEALSAAEEAAAYAAYVERYRAFMTGRYGE